MADRPTRRTNGLADRVAHREVTLPRETADRAKTKINVKLANLCVKDELDLLKFICKDFWGAIFRKQIDNLRTNHQGNLNFLIEYQIMLLQLQSVNFTCQNFVVTTAFLLLQVTFMFYRRG